MLLNLLYCISPSYKYRSILEPECAYLMKETGEEKTLNLACYAARNLIPYILITGTSERVLLKRHSDLRFTNTYEFKGKEYKKICWLSQQEENGSIIPTGSSKVIHTYLFPFLDKYDKNGKEGDINLIIITASALLRNIYHGNYLSTLKGVVIDIRDLILSETYTKTSVVFGANPNALGEQNFRGIESQIDGYL